MVDEAPPPEAVLPRLASELRGRVLVAHNARFDVGVLKQAFDRAALTWPDPPVLCTVALARRFAPLQRRRGLASLADALGVEVGVTHRALPDAETCARVLCALLPRLCANAETIGQGLALLRPRRAPARRRAPGAPRPRDQRPDLSGLPKDPGVYVFRDADGRPLYVGKSVCLRTRARAHFTQPATWTGQAEHVDYQPTESELGALVLENRLIKALRPPGNTQLKQGSDGYVYLRCRLDIAFPILEVAREPAAGNAVCVGPVRGRAAAAELIEQLNSLFGLRHCGRTLPRRPHASAYGQMGRCLSPCLGDLDPNLYRERLDSALALFEIDGGAALLAHVEAQMTAAAAAQRYERAAWLRRRRKRLESLIGRLGGALRAAHAGARLVLAPHPADRGALRRVLDRRRPDRRLGPAAAGPGRGRRPHGERARRGALARARRLAAGGRARRGPDRRHVARAHRGEAHARARPAAGRGRGRRVQRGVNGSSTTSAVVPSSPTASVVPGSASRRTIASAIGPWAGERVTDPTRPTCFSPSISAFAGRGRGGQAQPAQVAVRLAAVEQPRDGLLADVTALGERDRAVVEAGLLRDHRVVEVDPVARAAVLDAQRLGRLVGDRLGARGGQRRAHGLGLLGRAQHVDADVGGHEPHRHAGDRGRHVVVLARPEIRRRPRRAAPQGRSATAAPSAACACAARRRGRA